MKPQVHNKLTNSGVSSAGVVVDKNKSWCFGFWVLSLSLLKISPQILLVHTQKNNNMMIQKCITKSKEKEKKKKEIKGRGI